MMNVWDWIVVAIVGLAVLVGFTRGLVGSVIGFLGLGLGGWIGLFIVAPKVVNMTQGEGLRRIILWAMVCLGMGIGYTLGMWIGKLVSNLIGDGMLRGFDRIGGGVLQGGGVLLIIWVVVICLSSILGFSGSTGKIFQGKVVGYLVQHSPSFVKNFSNGITTQIEHSPAGEILGDKIKNDYGFVAKLLGDASSCNEQKSGSGVLVENSGGKINILTNAHVVSGVKSVQVVLNGLIYPGTVTYFDPAADVSVVNIKNIPSDISPIKVSKDFIQPVDSNVIEAGYTQNGQLVVNQTKILNQSDISTGSTFKNVYTLSGLLTPGMSGGAVVNDQNNLVGLLFANQINNTKNTQEQSYALTLKQIQAAVSSLGNNFPVNTGSC